MFASEMQTSADKRGCCSLRLSCENVWGTKATNCTTLHDEVTFGLVSRRWGDSRWSSADPVHGGPSIPIGYISTQWYFTMLRGIS